MDVVKQLRTMQLQASGSPGVDPQAMVATKDIAESEKVALWEHEDLAKVRIRVFRGHTAEVNKCQFFCEESRVLSASEDCSVKIWDPMRGTEIQSIDNTHSINTTDASCMEDGSKFASCGWDKAVHVWDLETCEPIWSAKSDDMLTCCHLSQDGRLLCVGSDLFHNLTIYDVASGEVVNCLKDYHMSTLTSCAFSPNDTRIYTTSLDKTAKFFDLRSLTCTIHLEGHDNCISSCSISLDERKFATGSWDKTIRIWDIATGMYRSTGPATLKGSHEGSVTACNFTDDGLQLVSGSADLSIVVWDVENNVQKLKLQGHSDWVTDVHFSQDQCWILSSAKDTTVRMWNIEESDKIPIVMETKKAQGLKVTKCSSCGKPFSMSEMENFREVTTCVFCRLQSPEKAWLAFEDEPES